MLSKFKPAVPMEQSASERRHQFGSTRMPSVDDGTKNAFFPRAHRMTSSELSDAVINKLVFTQEDEGIAASGVTPEPPLIVYRNKPSKSTPLDRNVIASLGNIPKSKSQDEVRMTRPQESDESRRRRSSYGQESGYGSKGSTETNAADPTAPDTPAPNTPGTAAPDTPDEVFRRESNGNGGRRPSQGKLRSMVSRDPELPTCVETSESPDYIGSHTGPQSSACGLSQNHDFYWFPGPNQYNTPDFSMLDPRSVSGSSNSSIGSQSSQRRESEDLGLLPAQLNSLQSLILDPSHRNESQLTEDYMLVRCRYIDQLIKSMMRRGEPPERIDSICRGLISIDSSTCSYMSQSESSPWSPSQDLLFQFSPITSPCLSRPVLRHMRVEGEKNTSQSSSDDEIFDSDELLTQLQAAVGCQSKGCPDMDCQQGQRLLQYIDRYLSDSQACSGGHNDIVLRTIAEHSDLCDELKCPIPWCAFFHEHDMPFEDQLARLHALHFSGCITLTSQDSDLNVITPLVSDAACKELVDWFGIVRLGTYGNTVLAVSAQLENPSYWIIKREGKRLLQHAQVLKKLRRHPRIVRHQWILEQDDYRFFAAKFEGPSLAERMNEAGQCGLPTICIFQYMQELTSAAKFLHTIKVAYLNWTVENVILSSNMKHVKLCNFSCAVLYEEVCEDEEILEDLALLLPPRIVPPELYRGEPVEAASDVWGLGCVCYQMATGHMLFHQYRHDPPSTIRETLEESRPEPDARDVSDETLGDILTQCLMIDPADRIPTAKLQKRFIVPVY